MMSLRTWLFTVAFTLAVANAGPIRDHQNPGHPIQRSLFPTGDPSPKWQTDHEVTESLPNVTFDFGRNFAGNVPIQRGTNLSLFYWAVESQNGSLTAAAGQNSDRPWQIWLNGGPGSSSMLGFFFENGPIRITPDYKTKKNEYAWTNLVDTFWVDQPVGTGYSTLEDDGSGQVFDENDVGRDFLQFLASLVKIYPSLAERPLIINGESYAGMYIPYIAKEYFGMSNPPVKLSKIAIGDGTIGNPQVYGEISTIYVLETFPQVIGYDIEVFKWFQEQNRLCKYDINFTYPETKKFPTIEMIVGEAGVIETYASRRKYNRRDFMEDVRAVHESKQHLGLLKRGVDREEARHAWKRDLTDRSNGTIDSWYGCDVYNAAVQYAANFTYPWNDVGKFSYYNVPSALKPSVFQDATVFLNDNQTKKAIHAPAKRWAKSTGLDWAYDGWDLSPEPMTFLDDLATNATKQNVSVIIYSGNLDSLIGHRGSEAVIQNTTFGGIQGFTSKPSTPWYNDDKSFAGVVHQERGWTYVLFAGAGHLVPAEKPAAALTFLREFILGNNQTGLVTSSGVVGGEDPKLAVDVLPEGPEIYLGSYVTTGTYTYPSQTIAQFNDFLASVTATPSP